MHDNIIFMKYGRHADQDVARILKDKKADLERFGYFYWGYGGSACNPGSQVQPFVDGAGAEVRLLMSYTPSTPSPSTKPVPQHEYSCDNINWMAIPDGLHITGSKWAVVCDSLTECDFQLYPHEYEVAVGPNESKRLDQYVKGQSDKACARRRGLVQPDEDQVAPHRIRIMCSLMKPYAVFVR